MYNTSDWYWFVGGDFRRVWSSARRTYVDVSDDIYLAWLDNNGNTTTSILSEDELADALADVFPAGSPRGPRILSPIDFLNRLTDDELNLLCNTALTVAPILRICLEFTALTQVDVEDTKVSEGLAAFVTAGVLDSSRPAQILSRAIS